MHLAVAPTVDATIESPDKTAYAYGTTGLWANAFSNVTYTTSICRKGIFNIIDVISYLYYK